MYFEFNLVDNASPFTQEMIAKFPDATRGALKSTGYWMMKEIQAGIAKAAPGGNQYPAFFPQVLRQALDRVVRGRGKSVYPPLGNLQKAIKYSFQNSGARGMSVVVGWTSASGIYLGSMQQEGFSRPMTDSMRRAFDAMYQKLGLKMRIKKTTTAIVTPARPTIEPMKNLLAPDVAPKFEAVFLQYLKNGPVSRSPSGNKRAYPVLKSI